MPPVAAILLPILRRSTLALAVVAMLLSALRLHAHPPGHGCAAENVAMAGTDATAGIHAMVGNHSTTDVGGPTDPYAPDGCDQCQCPPPALGILEPVRIQALAGTAQKRPRDAGVAVPDSLIFPPEPPPILVG